VQLSRLDSRGRTELHTNRSCRTQQSDHQILEGGCSHGLSEMTWQSEPGRVVSVGMERVSGEGLEMACRSGCVMQCQAVAAQGVSAAERTLSEVLWTTQRC